MNTGQSIARQLQHFLAREKENNPGEPQYIFDTTVDNLRVHVCVSDFDRFSFLLTRLEFRDLNKVMVTPEWQKRVADQLTSKLTYLLEELRVVEIDTQNHKVQLRSRSPESDQHHLAFYEMVVDANGGVSLLRYRFDKDSQTRSAAPFHLTNEVFAKLINDLADAIQS